MTIIAECLFCGSSNHVLRFRASDRWHEVEGSYCVCQCLDCGLLFLDPQPSEDLLAAHYPSTYYSLQDNLPDQERDERLYEVFYGSKPNIFEKAGSLPYKPVLRTLVGDAGQRMLDVGCGAGHFLSIVKKVRGMEAFGVEPYPFNRSLADKENLNIYNGSLPDAAFPADFFDVVTLNHVFEHMANPRSTLCELKRILKPGGSLVIGVPQSSCLLYWLFGRCWKQLDVPRHLFIPSSKNLKNLVEDAGFHVKRIRYNSMPSSILGTLFYRMNDIFGRRRYLHQFKENKFPFFVVLPLAYLLNFLRLGDQIEILATKN